VVRSFIRKVIIRTQIPNTNTTMKIGLVRGTKYQLEHKHFHSLNCMKVWLAKNHEAVTLLLTNMGNNDNNNETIERT
jgi:hypothetical protein